jgi:RND family efflux transporter MFP subunit
MSDLQAKQANFKSSEDQLNKLKEDLVKSKVIAPEAGLVVYHKDYWRGDAITLGGTVHYRQRLLNLPDTSELTVHVKVHESRISQLAVNQTAYVTLDTIPGTRFKGTVMQVAPMPDPQSFWNPGLKVYTIQVLIKDKMPPDVKPGLSARAEVIIDKLEKALIVPIQSITTVDKKQVAYVLTDAGAEMKPVTIGSYNETHVEIKDGLNEGDKILLAPPSKDEALALGLSIVSTDEVEKSDVVKGKKPAPKKGGRPSGMPPRGMGKRGK